MKELIVEEQVFEGSTSKESNLPMGDYYNCTFKNFMFEADDLLGKQYFECEFIQCDLSACKLNDVAFRECLFMQCKMLGLHFSDCNPFLLAFRFEECQLNLSSFYQLSIKNTWFTNCSLSEVDFTETNLIESVFSACNLSGAVFERSKLEKVDFRTAMNFQLNPEQNSMKGARFSSNNLEGLLLHLPISIE